MAVLEAVRGYEYYAGLPPSNDRDRAKEEEADAAADEILESESPEAIEQLEDGEWTTEQLQQGLDNLLEEDFDSLLLEHDQFVGAETTGSVCEYKIFLFRENTQIVSFSIRLVLVYSRCFATPV